MIVAYKCPKCGGDMEADFEKGIFLCESCGFIISDENYKENNARFSLNASDNLRLSKCRKCGAEIFTDSAVSYVKCCFCGSPMAMSRKTREIDDPKFVLPFKISKAQAQSSFKKWCRNGFFCPSGFASEERIADIIGIYLPFMLYDMNVLAETAGEGRQIKKSSDSQYKYTETKRFSFERAASLEYEKVPVNASKIFSDEFVNKLEPFDYSKAVPFDITHMTGRISEKYVPEGGGIILDKALKKVSGNVKAYIKDSLNQYSSVNFGKFNIGANKFASYYVLVPIWLIYCSSSDNIFAVNGQTGKISGRPPLSKMKIFLWYIFLTAVFSAFAALILLIFA